MIRKKLTWCHASWNDLNRSRWRKLHLHHHHWGMVIWRLRMSTDETVAVPKYTRRAYFESSFWHNMALIKVLQVTGHLNQGHKIVMKGVDLFTSMALKVFLQSAAFLLEWFTKNRDGVSMRLPFPPTRARVKVTPKAFDRVVEDSKGVQNCLLQDFPH